MSREYYKLAERPRQCDVDKLNVSVIGLNWTSPTNSKGIGVMAVSIGETRPPKVGEWYLSGDEVAAWRATNDLPCSYLILKLVIVETKVATTIVTISE